MITKNLKPLIIVFFFILGVILFSINIYGLFQEIRPFSFAEKELRFSGDSPTSYKETIALIKRLTNETDVAYTKRVNEVISNGLAHIHWTKFKPEKFNQLVPIWENYILFFMGKFSGIPEYQRYHFADYRRSLNRGIGICGDASMILSQTLNAASIKNKIVTFPGHVAILVTFSDGSQQLHDPDFGVSLPFNIEKLQEDVSLVKKYYLAKGYTEKDFNTLKKTYSGPYELWDGVNNFITKKYYFEYIAYFLKWLLPIIFIIYPIYTLRKKIIKNLF